MKNENDEAELNPTGTPCQRWPAIVDSLRDQSAPSAVFQDAWQKCFADWDEQTLGPPPMWIPPKSLRAETNVGKWLAELGMDQFDSFHRWSVEHRAKFWQAAVARLGIRFNQPAAKTLDLSGGIEHANWFPGAQMNIVESCFQAPVNLGDPPDEQPAIVFQQPNGPLQTLSYRQLRQQTNRVANSLIAAGFGAGDAIAVVLPMTAVSVSIYLGIVQAGCVVVSIADSFAPPEIASRLKIAATKAVFTYDVQLRAGKKLPLFERVCLATEIPAVVLSCSENLAIDLRQQDIAWKEFLLDDDSYQPAYCDRGSAINILFSSGTTGDPKAIAWNHLTPIKCAVDGYCHQDIRPGDVCVWPTNLGWMMGPWLIFASLINRATIGIYEDAPMGPGFGRFVGDAKVNLLGVVPSIVKAWRLSGEMEQFDWSSVRAFSSTGESSQRDDMVYLSSLAGMKPVVEYCGGTEIGGGYVTSSLLQPNVPAAFNTPAVGLDFVLIDQRRKLVAATDDVAEGEVYLVPPSIGLSDRLLNRDHFATYYQDTPAVPGYELLRRHGDHFRRLPGGIFVAGGRVDDTMNLGGIKVSSAEIERVLNRVHGVLETAAIAQSDNGGPQQLVVYAVLESTKSTEFELSKSELTNSMNSRLKSNLNPLFKIGQLKIVAALPRTASGKILRRELRR